MSILKFDNVSKIFYTKEHQTVALDKLSFEINEGEFVALIGPSGCGKTTILSLVCGLIDPTSGRVIRKGEKDMQPSSVAFKKDDEKEHPHHPQAGASPSSIRGKLRNKDKTPPHNGESECVGIFDTTEQTADKTQNIGASGVSQNTICNESTECPNAPYQTKRLFSRSRESAYASVGYMLQRDQLFEWRTIEKNVLLGLEIQNKKTPENVEKAQELLKKYGLWEFRKHYPQQLSGGMRQRVALIRTLGTNPDLLLLDEPFSALDFQTRLDVCDDVYEIIKKENKTALLVTHDISEAIALADKVIVLSARPATVKAIHFTNMSDIDTPLHRRQSPDFSRQFEYLHNLLHNA